MIKPKIYREARGRWIVRDHSGTKWLFPSHRVACLWLQGVHEARRRAVIAA